MSLGSALGAIPIVGGFIGAQNSSNAGDKYAEQMRQLLEYYKGLDTDAAAAGASPMETAYAGITPDQSAMDAQQNSLQYLQNVQNQGGMTLEDKAALNNAQLQQQAADQSQRNAILQQTGARGGLNNGATLGAQLIGRQQTSNQAANDALNVGAMAQRRKLQAALDAGTLGGQIRNASFGEAATRAGAQDAATQFNKGLLQQTFANKMGLAGARAGLSGGAAQAQYAGTQNSIGLADAARRDLEAKIQKAVSAGGGGE